MPIYVADTDRQTREEAEESMMHFFRSIGRALAKADAADGRTKAREGRAQRLGTLTYDDILREHAIVHYALGRGKKFTSSATRTPPGSGSAPFASRAAATSGRLRSVGFSAWSSNTKKLS